ncbi:hypothetical protein PAXRUDRAFT_781180 [Paxillus rubicundulus Ve08.2h10]|uniref:Uncharacterized protein n=1 Tax=Paxillus rubicundulus Ve08.2h10 TaxID=930991 RepID=A0A0D0E2I8_9AGAM|nr:hypothetical protein PAXRUDRAFT_781180 [Paxillus rubicundulus Ve08.2h10]
MDSKFTGSLTAIHISPEGLFRGACGVTNGPNDFIVALNSAEYDGGAHCFEMITITINGKTTQAQITDEASWWIWWTRLCPGCAPGGLDFSQGLFQYFAPVSEGELYGSWYYNSDKPTSTSTPPPPATTTSYFHTSTPPPTTTTTTTTTSSSSLSSTSTSSATTSTPSSSSPLSPVPTFTPQDPQILVQIDVALIEFGSLLQASLWL